MRVYYNNNVHLLRHCCHLRTVDFICRPTVSFVSQMTLECGKSKSKRLKWQQCPSI